MIAIPDPLHPAVVHFPIVLILIGTASAVIAAIMPKWHLPVLAACLLCAGALGAIAATWSGDRDEEVLGELDPTAEHVLEEHEEWGETTRNSALVAAVLSVAALVTVRIPLAAKILAVLAAAGGIWASFAVVQAGHYGGRLVYKHGAGVNAAATIDEGPPATAPLSKKHREDAD